MSDWQVVQGGRTDLVGGSKGGQAAVLPADDKVVRVAYVPGRGTINATQHAILHQPAVRRTPSRPAARAHFREKSGPDGRWGDRFTDAPVLCSHAEPPTGDSVDPVEQAAGC